MWADSRNRASQSVDTLSSGPNFFFLFNFQIYFRTFCGGKGANQAVMAAKMGTKVRKRERKCPQSRFFPKRLPIVPEGLYERAPFLEKGPK